jgi:TPR repeat protein
MRTFLPALALLLAAFPASAQNYEKGLQAQSEADWSMALNIFRPLAEKGHVGAQYHLGQMYERGDGVPRDVSEALRLWRMGAGQGDVTSMETLGDRYREGEGFPRDFAAARNWYRRAAEQGSLKAQYWLGRMYFAGEGGPPDDMEAYVWFSLAEARGSAQSSEYRDRIARRFTAEQLAEANRLAEARWEEIKRHR